MRPRRNIQLARIFGIRVGVSASWFLVLFVLIWWLARTYFPELVSGSQTTDYVIAVLAALGYFTSLVLHELGHALAARRLGIPIEGIDLWFFGGLSQMRRQPRTAAEELLVAGAGPAVTLALFLLCFAGIELFAGRTGFGEAALPARGQATTPVLGLFGWLGLVNAMLFAFNLVPAFPLDGGRIARALIWWVTGDRNRATQGTGRSGQAFALVLGVFGAWAFATGSFLGLMTMVLAFFLFQAAGAAVLQGALGRRIQDVKVADIMDREPVTVPAETTLIDARERFFLRYRWPWFAVVDPARHFLGVVRRQRVEEEIAAGRPALQVADVLDADVPVRVGPETPLETLLGSDALARLGAMVAVDGDGVLEGVVTLADVRRLLSPAT